MWAIKGIKRALPITHPRRHYNPQLKGQGKRTVSAESPQHCGQVRVCTFWKGQSIEGETFQKELPTGGRKWGDPWPRSSRCWDCSVKPSFFMWGIICYEYLIGQARGLCWGLVFPPQAEKPERQWRSSTRRSMGSILPSRITPVFLMDSTTVLLYVQWKAGSHHCPSK